MAAQIRQEINILDHNIAAAAADTTSNEIVQLDTTQYNGTVTYYFEVLCSKTAGDSVTISLRRSGTSTDDATIASASIPTTLGLVRSASFTPPAGETSYRVFVDYTSGTGAVVKAARIVVIQNATTLTNTETQIEIGNYNTGRTAESATILTNPKYWKYDASKWNGTTTFYAEAVYDSGSMDTVTIGIYESNDILAPSWSLNATIVFVAETTVPTRSRVAFTPVDGRWYTIFSHNGSMDNHDIYRAGIVVQQVENRYYFNDAAPTDAQAVWTNDANAFNGNESNYASIGSDQTGSESSNALYGKTTNAPASGGTISSVRVSFLMGSSAPTPPTITMKVYTSGLGETLGTLTSTGNSPGWTAYTTLSTPSGGWDWNKVQNLEAKYYISIGGSTGVASLVYEARIEVFTSTGFTKLEPQYLLSNTLFAAGTALQTFLTKWDSTEWDAGAGTITYNSQAEAANGSTSDVTIEQADGGGTVTNSTLTNIDNAQISSSTLTMPASENLDTKATTNAGDVAAARILVTYVYSAAAPSVGGIGGYGMSMMGCGAL